MFVLQACVHKETPFNVGFEEPEPQTKLPRNWVVQDGLDNYKIYADSLHAHSGKRSLVLERRNKGAQSFGTAYLHIPVDFKGSKVTLAGYIKTENIENGIVGLIMRIEGDAGWSLLGNMASEKVTGTGDWKRYEINLPLKTDARDIYIGVYSRGSGKVWVDDLEILVDGKEPVAAERINLPGALKDTTFRQGSKVVIDSLSPGLVDDLVVLGKVWGFLKYYHPAIAAGEYNWDFELFRVLPKVMAAKSKSDRNSILLGWVKGLKYQEPKGKPAALDSTKVKLLPDLEWLADKQELGDLLSGELESIRRSSWNAEHFYVDMQYVGNPAFKNESHYMWLDFPDDGYRLLALYRYWNIIQYYFPYRHLIGEDWANVLRRFIPQFIHAGSPEAYQLTTFKLISTIHDSHGTLTGKITEANRFMGKYLLPAEVRFVEGKATVFNVSKSDLQRGDIILKVNGKSVKEIQDRLGPFISASNEEQKLLGIAMRVLRGPDSTFSVEVAREGKVIELELNSNAPMFANPLDQRLQPGPWKVLGGNIGYTFLGSLKKDDIPMMMEKFQFAKGIIIDLRCYPLEMVGAKLCQYFTDKEVEFTKGAWGSVQRPGLFAFQTALKVGGRNARPYLGKVAVLVDGSTQSRAEFTAMALKAMPNVTIIGSRTSGTDGDVSVFYLPGGLKTQISGVGYYWPDGRETQRVGIMPDIIVQPTLKGVRAGEDEVLNFALSYLKK